MKAQFWVISLACLLMTACSTQSTETPDTPETLGTEVTYQTLFNNSHFGMTKEDIEKSAGGDLSKKDSGSLLFTKDLNDRSFVDIHYSFKGGELNKMEANFFSNDLDSAKKTHAEHSRRFDQTLKKRDNLWEGQNGDVGYTVFCKLLENKDNPGVLITWERI